MDFVSNQLPQIKEMLADLGLSDISQLFVDIPKDLQLPPLLQDDGISEYEGKCLMENLAEKNEFSKFENYLGAGAYEHHIPAIVSAICSKSEFLTSYTPYQPEASQGMLQIIFEFQSAICALTDMDMANASVYDGSSACAEAILMSLRHQKPKNKVLVLESCHPHYLNVIKLYVSESLAKIEIVKCLENGEVDLDDFQSKIDNNTASILIQYPNFYGVVDDIQVMVKIAKEKDVLTILSANPLIYGLFASAGELGADIALGDCQPFGLPLHFGGPYVGYMSCKKELVRQLPGRIAGETVDTEGRRGFVLTLQAREQHIRREKATSNICTNQALAALASLISIIWYGKQGLKELALTNYQRAAYLKDELSKLPGLSIVTDGCTFNEFVIRFNQSLNQIVKVFREHHIEPGLALEKYHPQYKNCLLVTVTETKSKEQLDRFVKVCKIAYENTI